MSVVIVAAVSASACTDGGTGDGSGTDTPSSTGSTSAAGPWSFIDDRHIEVTADTIPVNIVAQEDSAAALIDFGIRPVGIFASAPLDENPLFEGVDLTGIESVGEVWAEIDIEKVASLDPDLIVTTFWEDPNWLWGMDAEGAIAGNLSQIAPIVALNSQVHLATIVGRFAELAGSLGVDLESPEMVAARQGFEDGLASLRTASEQNPAIDVVAVAPWSDQYYVASPANFPDLSEYVSAGVRVVTPPSTDDNFYAYLSYENLDKFQGDVMLHDARSFALTLEDLAELPTWNALPAVEAGQLVPWEVSSPPSYQRATAQIQALAIAIESADDVV